MNKTKPRALIIGLGVSGQSAARFLLQRGAFVQGVDKKVELLSQPSIQELQKLGLQVSSDREPVDFKTLDLVVVSPGVPSDHPLRKEALQNGVDVIGEVELGCRSLIQPCIGITGTNGKTTVTLLTAHVLNHWGKTAKALGNVGVPITSEIDLKLKKEDIIVAELSSYQLETLSTPILDVAVILNITPDHLDRYPSMEEYAKAKIAIKNCLKPKKPLLVEGESYQTFRPLFSDFPVETYGYDSSCDYFISKDTVQYRGEAFLHLPLENRGQRSHDLENEIASYAMCKEFGITISQFQEALTTFRKPSHRVEFIREFAGVSFYDDSKGTNIDAVSKAVRTLSHKAKKIVLIAGGVDKGSSYLPWIPSFAGKVSKICTIGQAAEKIECELGQEISVTRHASLENAFLEASRSAKEGDIVLLSPGCSSFDMFRDYAHRGDEFKRLVYNLGEKK